VDPAYFSALRIPLLAAGTLHGTRPSRSSAALVVNRAFERRTARSSESASSFVSGPTLRQESALANRRRGRRHVSGRPRPVHPAADLLAISQTGLDGGDYVICTSRRTPNSPPPSPPPFAPSTPTSNASTSAASITGSATVSAIAVCGNPHRTFRRHRPLAHRARPVWNHRSGGRQRRKEMAIRVAVGQAARRSRPSS